MRLAPIGFRVAGHKERIPNDLPCHVKGTTGVLVRDFAPVFEIRRHDAGIVGVAGKVHSTAPLAHAGNVQGGHVALGKLKGLEHGGCQFSLFGHFEQVGGVSENRIGPPAGRMGWHDDEGIGLGLFLLFLLVVVVGAASSSSRRGSSGKGTLPLFPLRSRSNGATRGAFHGSSVAFGLDHWSC